MSVFLWKKYENIKTQISYIWKYYYKFEPKYICDVMWSTKIIWKVQISAVVDTTFVNIYVDTKNIPTCRYNIQNINKRTMEK